MKIHNNDQQRSLRPSNPALRSDSENFNFDGWAKAVRQQLLMALNRQHASRFIERTR